MDKLDVISKDLLKLSTNRSSNNTKYHDLLELIRSREEQPFTTTRPPYKAYIKKGKNIAEFCITQVKETPPAKRE